MLLRSIGFEATGLVLYSSAEKRRGEPVAVQAQGMALAFPLAVKTKGV